MIVDDVMLTPDELTKTRQKYYTCINNPKSDSLATEREAYDCQMKFLETRDFKYLEQLERSLFPYVKSLVLQKVKLAKYKFIEEEQVDRLAEIALNKFMGLYYKPKPFAIWGSFGGYLAWKVLDALGSYVIQREKTISLDTPISDNGQTLEDIIRKDDDFTDQKTNFLLDFFEKTTEKFDCFDFEQELKLYKLFSALLIDLLRKKQCVYNLNTVYSKVCRINGIDKKTQEIGEMILVDLLKEGKRHAYFERDVKLDRLAEKDSQYRDFESEDFQEIDFRLA